MADAAPFSITKHDRFWRCSFSAMASPCEILLELETGNSSTIQHLAELAQQEALRIEHKFSRYRDDNIIHAINHAQGQAIVVDDETARLLDYADQLYRLSEGLFDITSGVLRRVWRFDGSDKIPSADAINAILPYIGWDKAQWKSPQLTLATNMEIDLGGIGKEYAVDKTAQILKQQTDKNFVVNFGGDLYVSGPQANGTGWLIGLDDPAHTGERALGTIELQRGGLATSGDARRFLLKNDVRYSHILNPKTGWPVANAPRGVTVIASTCTEAGMLATFAMLQGANADQFLKEQQVTYWCY